MVEGVRQKSDLNRFFTDLTGHRVHYADGRPGWRYLDENRRVSAWRISTGRTHRSQQNRVMYRAIQCHDVKVPMLPPTFLLGDDKRCLFHPSYAADDYTRLLRRVVRRL